MISKSVPLVSEINETQARKPSRKEKKQKQDEEQSK